MFPTSKSFEKQKKKKVSQRTFTTTNTLSTPPKRTKKQPFAFIPYESPPYKIVKTRSGRVGLNDFDIESVDEESLNENEMVPDTLILKSKHTKKALKKRIKILESSPEREPLDEDEPIRKKKAASSVRKGQKESE